MTNGAEPVEPTECYARLYRGKWIYGCSYKKASEFDQKFARDIIAR